MIVFDDRVLLTKVISGGQTGADQAGLFSAKIFNFETGGFAPQGFRTLIGNKARMLRDTFHLEETSQRNYQVRTALNVQSSDATVRLATNFNSPGELCTLKAIKRYGKPFIDIDLLAQIAAEESDREAYINSRAEEFIRFLVDNQVSTLNVAGNADRQPEDGFGIHFHAASEFLICAFAKIKNETK